MVVYDCAGWNTTSEGNLVWDYCLAVSLSDPSRSDIRALILEGHQGGDRYPIPLLDWGRCLGGLVTPQRPLPILFPQRLLVSSSEVAGDMSESPLDDEFPCPSRASEIRQ